nr:MAG TPA: Poxvirus A11 Protein [Crassvirales sp.]
MPAPFISLKLSVPTLPTFPSFIDIGLFILKLFCVRGSLCVKE